MPTTYTDAELLAYYREAMVTILTGGQSYSIGNRSFSRADLAEIRSTIEWLEGRIADASAGDTGGGNVLVQFGQEQ